MMRTALIGMMLASMLAADVRVNLRVGVGHPVRRPVPTVVVRPPRTPVVVARPAPRYLPVVVYRPAPVALPARAGLHWEDRETIHRREDWVDMDFHVDGRGRAVYFGLDARTQVNFAEVTFGNGETQVVDFNDAAMAPGAYRLLDIADGRKVESVRMVARTRAPKSTITVYLAK